MMQQMLEQEGVAIENCRVQAFEHLFWHPAELGDDFSVAVG
jgi:hypothetical protein